MGGHASPEAVVGVIVTFTVLATACCGLRLYARQLLIRGGGWDDFFICAATFHSIFLTVTICLQVHYGMGTHSASLTAHQIKYSNVWFWVSVWMYYLALLWAKLSILTQYSRIFVRETFRRVNIAVMAAVVICSCWTVFSAIFACRPIRYFWEMDKTMHPDGRCLNRLAVWYFNAAVNIISDIVIAAMPLPLLRSLQIPKRSKVALMMVFGLGGVTCIISILRLTSLRAVATSDDTSWSNPLAATWSSLEVNTGIICSCLPTLKALVTKLYPKFFSSAYGISASHRTPGLEPLPASDDKSGFRAPAPLRRATIERDANGILEMKCLPTVDVEEATDWRQALGHQDPVRTQRVYEQRYLDGEDEDGVRVAGLAEQSRRTALRKQSDPSLVESTHQQSSAPSVKEMY